MAGGLLQIVLYGPQDLYLTDNPQITFFKIVYRRHTNFSIESLEKTFNDNPDFGKRSTTQLLKIGDLATKMYLKITLSELYTPDAKYAWIKRLGHAILKSVEIRIGQSRIDKQYGTWLDIWYELARNGDMTRGYLKMIGDTDELTKFNSQIKPQYTIWLPLQFWFNRYYGLALPLIAIQHQEVYITVIYEEKERLIIKNKNFNMENIKILDVGLVTDYIYLDIDERKKFAELGHEYLIEIVQSYESELIYNQVNRFQLDFNFPTKELIWAMKSGNYTSGKKFLTYCNDEDWSKCLIEASKQLIKDSSLITPKNKIINLEGEWEFFLPNSKKFSSNKNLYVINNSNKNSLVINTKSLYNNKINLMDNISATIILTQDPELIINLQETLTEKDISIPLDELIDTRINKESVYVYQFSNYGMYITGNKNPIEYSQLQYNEQERVEKRNSKFYGDLMPYLNNSNTPKDGINVYSFAIEPEKLQPSGTSNLSRIENITLSNWLYNKEENPYYDFNNKFYIYGFSYNILKIMYGLTALAYTS